MQLLERLEYFFVSGDAVKRAVREFFRRNPVLNELLGMDPTTEQKAEHYEIFRRYGSVIEEQLCEFLATEKTNPEHLLLLLRALPARQRESLISLDFLSAALEYQDFVVFVNNYHDLFNATEIEEDVITIIPQHASDSGSEQEEEGD
eukprot:TRINITY_DN426_c0_g1_i1.p1 TRINITY_DN426_c0_g1~~TRINITY_DN426_c0_g1_i1.p1  ORF type:complete len:155 (+),score=45.25 TRINITY_DN426_c0_g1_i1:25-465(+)